MKLSVVGLGRVGAANAVAPVARVVPHELVLVGRTRERRIGDAHDQQNAAAFARPVDVVAGVVAETAGSDIVRSIATIEPPSTSRRGEGQAPTAVALLASDPAGRGGWTGSRVESGREIALATSGVDMGDDRTSAVVERYLIALAGDTPADPVIRELLDRAVGRLRILCAGLLHRGYPRLTRPPVNLDADELLGAVVERLLKAMREARPATVRQFYALANRHIRWELNDLARRLDEQPGNVELCDGLVPAAQSSGSALGPDGRRILQAIEDLPEDEREIFDLVRIQGLSHAEVAELLNVSCKTVQRRLRRGLSLLSQGLEDLRPHGETPGS